MPRLLSGNEAIAHGAWEAGARVAAAYPGTPSTETLEHLSKLDDVYTEWCTNEKVALEVAIGSSAAGARSLATMKHVGVNVAADPLFTSSYTGVGAGLVILAADDPGMYSSQNEQDSHYYAKAASVLMMDPADSQEAHDFTIDAFDISEEFDTPVFIRSSVRISHTKTPVELGERDIVDLKPYETDRSKWVMMPLYAKERHKVQLDRTGKLSQWVEDCKYNRVIDRGDKIGVICSGAAYQHVMDALEEASVFKLGITWPLPERALKEFADSVDEVYVVEEASDYLTESVAALGIELSNSKIDLPRFGELTPSMIRGCFGLPTKDFEELTIDIPGRPPALCPGCPHRIVFKELARQKAIITGDIGCYTLGALPPLNAMDSVVDMGASVSMAHGFEVALRDSEHRPIVAVIGDSTFAHSGLSSLIGTVYNNGAGTICILDNRTTAMTGRQGNPFNGEVLPGHEGNELDLLAIITALGVDHVSVVDPNDLDATRSTIKEAINAEDRLDVIIFKRPCALLERVKDTPYMVSDCKSCGVCISLGCPAIGKDIETSMAYIDADSCIGCGQCSQYCKFDAISRMK